MELIDIFKSIKNNVICCIVLDMIAAMLCVAASLSLTLFVQRIIDGKYIEAMYMILLNLGLYIVAYSFNYIYLIQKNKVKMLGTLKYREYITQIIRNAKSKIKESEYISKLNNDGNQIENAIELIFNLIDTILYVISAFVGLIILHWGIAIASLVIFSLNLILPRLLKKKSEENERLRSQNSENYLRNLTDFLEGYSVWNLYNKKGILTRLLDKENLIYEQKKNKINNTTSLIETIPSFGSVIGQDSLMLFAVALIYFKVVIPGVILSVGNLSGILFSNLSKFIKNIVKVKGINRLVKDNCVLFEKIDESSKEIENYDIKIKNLSFSYGDKKVLNNINLEFKFGKKYIIIGPSGTGKTTLFNLLSKSIENYSGEIYLGDHNYKNLNAYTIHKSIGYVTQKTHIFNASLKDNITLFDNGYSELHYKKAIKNSQVDEFIIDDDQVIEKNGNNLSGGQNQRIAIAREIIHGHKIILFDESTNSLDKAKNLEMIKYLTSLDQTVIFIAHNASEEIINNFEYVIDFENGIKQKEK